jgi:hypothetical protein
MARRRIESGLGLTGNYTTAQHLGALRRELIAEGFPEKQASEMAETAFRLEVEFVVCTANMAGEPVDNGTDDESAEVDV